MKHEELYYFETVQFASKVSASPDLDFILFGSYCNGRPQIFYIDCESYKHIGESTDLENADLHLSPLFCRLLQGGQPFHRPVRRWAPLPGF